MSFFNFLSDQAQSPTGPSAADIFSSPQPGNAKRRLFQPNPLPTVVPGSVKPGESIIMKQQGDSFIVKQLNPGRVEPLIGSPQVAEPLIGNPQVSKFILIQ